MTFTDKLARAAAHLAVHDITLAPIIQRIGPCTIRPHTNYYWELVDSIISQQLSVKAAHSIENRFCNLFDSKEPTPEHILKKSVEELRAIGLSNAKARYVRDLAQHVIDGRIVFDRIDDLTNEEIIAKLTDVKGIGEWTVHMFLIFCMGRLDVMPVGDLGIKNGIRQLYEYSSLPTPQEITAIAKRNHWHPYASVASWYIWQSLDNTPKVSV